MGEGRLNLPILERDIQFEQLKTLADAAATGFGHSVFITGEAGAGKTTLLRSFEGSMDGARVLRAACEDLSIPEPLGPLRDLALDAGVDLDTLLADESDRLSVFLRLLAAIDGSGDFTVMLVEDLHWADEATLDFLRFAGRRLRNRPVLMVVTSRDDETEGRPHIRRLLSGVPPSDVTRIPLMPLSPEAVAQLAKGTEHRPADLFRITGGNPFYVSELLRSGQQDALRTVQDTVLQRIDRLPPDAQAVLDAVSIFPRRAERDWVLTVANVEEDALDLALDTGLIEDGGVHVAFRHEIARQAVETALRPANRRRLNAKLLSVLQGADGVPNARQMHHARAAGDNAQTALLAPSAGREAMAAGANRQAADYFSIAVDLADAADTATLANLLFEAGEACRLIGRLKESMAYFERALPLVQDDPTLSGRILQRLSRVMWAAGLKVQCRALGDKAIALLDGAETNDLAMALASRAQIAMSDYMMEKSLPLARRAEAIARRLGRMDIVSHALSTQSLASLFTSSEINELYEESISAAKSARSAVNLVRCYANGGVVNWYSLRFKEGLELCTTAISTAYETDTLEQVDFHQGFRVYLLDRTGAWDEALSTTSDILSRELESASPAIMLRLTTLRIKMRRGETDGKTELQTILALLGDEEDSRHIVDVAAIVAETAWLGLEDAATAQDFMDEALKIPINPMLKEEFLYWQRRVDPSRLPSDLQGLHAPYRSSISGDWETAAAEWRKVGDPYREALAFAEGTADDVERAIEILEKLGAARVIERILKAAHARGVAVTTPVAHRASTLANPAGLTQRQMEVLALLDEGLSNAQIGERLFVSAKTVDHHVSAILGKLEVGSRGEAAALARDAGWLSQR